MRTDFAPKAFALLPVRLPHPVLRCLEHRKYCATEAVASPTSRRPLHTLKYATDVSREKIVEKFRLRGSNHAGLPSCLSLPLGKMVNDRLIASFEET